MTTASGNLLDRSVIERPAVAALLARARDTGTPQLGAPVELTIGPRLLLVAADHEGSDASTGEPTVGELRSQLRSEEHTSELQSLMRISYAVFCLKKKKKDNTKTRK